MLSEPGDDNMSLEQAFDRSFSGTIKSLDPAGAAIDTPLTLFSDLPDEALVELSNRMVLRSFGLAVWDALIEVAAQFGGEIV